MPIGLAQIKYWVNKPLFYAEECKKKLCCYCAFKEVGGHDALLTHGLHRKLPYLNSSAGKGWRNVASSEKAWAAPPQFADEG